MATKITQPEAEETETPSIEERFPFLADQTVDTIGEFVADNVTSMRDLDELKVTGRGLWEIPVLTKKPRLEETIRGIIVTYKEGRALWPEFKQGERSAPLCYSDDLKVGWGIYGIDPETGEPSPNSTTFGRCYINSDRMCQMAKFGGTKAKPIAPACRQKTVLFVVLEGDTLPTRISLSGSSLKHLNKFKQDVRKVGVQGVVATLTMESKGSYSEVVIKEVEVLSREHAAVAKAYGKAIQEAFPPRNADLIASIPVLPSAAALRALPSGNPEEEDDAKVVDAVSATPTNAF